MPALGAATPSEAEATIAPYADVMLSTNVAPSADVPPPLMGNSALLAPPLLLFVTSPTSQACLGLDPQMETAAPCLPLTDGGGVTAACPMPLRAMAWGWPA
jgi:hypothetical protein